MSGSRSNPLKVKLRRYAAEAGYRDVAILPIENDTWRFYRLWP